MRRPLPAPQSPDVPVETAPRYTSFWSSSAWLSAEPAGARLMPLVRADSGAPAAECVHFSSGYTWGAVRSADVRLSGQAMVVLPPYSRTRSIRNIALADRRQHGAVVQLCAA